MDQKIDVPTIEELLKAFEITKPSIKSKDCDYELRRLCLCNECKLPSMHCEHP